jgi:copper resistance protein D
MTILPVLVAARWIHFAALLLLFGAPVSCLLVRGADPMDARAIFQRTDRLLRVTAALAVISGLVWIAAIIANMAGSFADAATVDTLNAFFFETQFGPVVIARLVLLIAALLTIMLPAHVRLGAWLLIGAGLLIDQAWLGHAANGGATLFGALMIAVYCTHVLAGGTWIGGLPVLLFTLGAPRAGPQERANVLLRFSNMATAAVTLIVLSGILNALFRVHGHPMRLFGTSYGDVLLTKITLVAAMLVFAAYNRLIGLPKLETQAQATANSNLTLSIAVELVLGGVVVGAAAILGVTPPPA